MVLALVNLVVAAALCGVIWTIQLVHYPLFARVPVDGWTEYEKAHQRAITPLVLPVMAANVLLGALLVASGPAGAESRRASGDPGGRRRGGPDEAVPALNER